MAKAIEDLTFDELVESCNSLMIEKIMAGKVADGVRDVIMRTETWKYYRLVRDGWQKPREEH